jgi:transcriptional regulator with XRE-family HTH domain
MEDSMQGIELKKWRREQGWNQTQMARYLGTSQVNISRWESGKYDVPDFIAHLAYLLNDKRNVRSLENFLYKTH